MRQTDASHVAESIPVITRLPAARVKCRTPAVALKMTGRIQTVLCFWIARPSSELCIRQTNATDDSESVSVTISPAAVL
eukprot:8642898-Pyramimonas_sp.AAC.1